MAIREKINLNLQFSIMKRILRYWEISFEKFASFAIAVLGNSVTFVIALCLVIVWLSSRQFREQNMHSRIQDVILGLTFLFIFIIQKSFNRFSASLHLKVNELVSSHEPASNSVINVEGKTEHEISALSKEYDELNEEVKELKEEDYK